MYDTLLLRAIAGDVVGSVYEANHILGACL